MANRQFNTGRLCAVIAVGASLTAACLATAESAQPPAPTSTGTQASLLNGGLTLTIPTGFIALTKAQIKHKFPTVRPPQYVFDDAPKAVEIAVTYSSNALPPDKLGELSDIMMTNLPKMRHDLVVLSHEMITINGVQWVEIDAVNNAGGISTDDEMLFTSLNGLLLGVNLIATHDTTNADKAELKTVQASLKLTSIVTTPSAPATR